MADKADLDKNLDSATFRRCYYLKEELIRFCRREGLKTAGAKSDLNERIFHYLDTGEKLAAKTKPKLSGGIGEITGDTLIEDHLICSEKHRAFFKEAIGSGFSFNVTFQGWLKSNAGKSYKDAVSAYRQIAAGKKKRRTEIGKQFEYNAYIRDFFADNKGKSLSDAIRCWKYKKSLQGCNKYEKSDLTVLKK